MTTILVIICLSCFSVILLTFIVSFNILTLLSGMKQPKLIDEDQLELIKQHEPQETVYRHQIALYMTLCNEMLENLKVGGYENTEELRKEAFKICLADPFGPRFSEAARQHKEALRRIYLEYARHLPNFEEAKQLLTRENGKSRYDRLHLFLGWLGHMHVLKISDLRPDKHP